MNIDQRYEDQEVANDHFNDWCSDNGLDPDDNESHAAYEEAFDL